MKPNIEIVPYGGVRSALSKPGWRTIRHHVRASKSLERSTQRHRRIFVSFSCDLDESFAEMFHEKATQNTRLLILDEGASMDRLVARIIDLQIRTPQRCYIVEAPVGSGKTHFVRVLLERLVSALEADDKQERILDARLENGILHVISPNFDRLDVSIAEIPEFKNLDVSKIQEFEIDEDGAFIYWPKLDVHLGWTQLQQAVDPKAVLKASQKSEEFNKRYGQAVKRVREQAGLKPTDISGLSEKQLGRIERGECRLTSNAIEALSEVHKLAPNEYMKKLAEALR